MHGNIDHHNHTEISTPSDVSAYVLFPLFKLHLDLHQRPFTAVLSEPDYAGYQVSIGIKRRYHYTKLQLRQRLNDNVPKGIIGLGSQARTYCLNGTRSK